MVSALDSGVSGPTMDWHPIHGGVEILQVASCYRHGTETGISSGLMGHKWLVCRFYLFLGNLSFW